MPVSASNSICRSASWKASRSRWRAWSRRAYALEAARAVTASMVSAGREARRHLGAAEISSRPSACAQSVNDALDIHGGKGICDGPSNYIQGAYQMVPVGITVEGANILTRTLITFAQGALRSHPYLFTEIEAAAGQGPTSAASSCSRAPSTIMSPSPCRTPPARLFHNVTFGLFASAPPNAGATRGWWRELARAARSFALVADLTVALLGGGLKVKQKITGRMADALAELYLLSSVLKRFDDDGRPPGRPQARRLLRQELPLPLRSGAARRAAKLSATLGGLADGAAGVSLRRTASARRATRRARRSCARRSSRAPSATVSPERSSSPTIPPTGRACSTIRSPRSVACEEADKKLERAIRKGEVKRFHDHDWIGEAEAKGVLTSDEARDARRTARSRRPRHRRRRFCRRGPRCRQRGAVGTAAAGTSVAQARTHCR